MSRRTHEAPPAEPQEKAVPAICGATRAGPLSTTLSVCTAPPGHDGQCFQPAPPPPADVAERAYEWLRYWVDEGDSTSDRTGALTALLTAVAAEAEARGRAEAQQRYAELLTMNRQDVAAAVEAEREACARECEAERDEWQADYDQGHYLSMSKIGLQTARACAYRIRRRSERPRSREQDQSEKKGGA